MDSFSHHAYLLLGRAEAVRESLWAHLRERGISTEQNPDFREMHLDSLSVDDARGLKEAQMRKPFGNGVQVFVLSFWNATHEAQNALLKVFEEPTPNTIFFVITEHEHGLLPTLRSRLQTLTLESVANNSDRMSADTFLAQEAGERFASLKTIIEEKRKDDALQLIGDIETILHASIKRDPSAVSALKELEKVRGYLHDRGASLKLLLEYTALICPRLEGRRL